MQTPSGIIAQHQHAERLNIIERTLLQLIAIIEDLPANALPEPDRLINAEGNLQTALRSVRIIRETGPTAHILD